MDMPVPVQQLRAPQLYAASSLHHACETCTRMAKPLAYYAHTFSAAHAHAHAHAHASFPGRATQAEGHPRDLVAEQLALLHVGASHALVSEYDGLQKASKCVTSTHMHTHAHTRAYTHTHTRSERGVKNDVQDVPSAGRSLVCVCTVSFFFRLGWR